ncbi:MAG TPA: PAS domain S-box protein [Candidatus Obscuribacterales bacterium]
MNIGEFSPQLEAWRSQLAALLRLTNESPSPPELLTEVFDELQAVLEQLAVAEEDLRQQNEELVQTRMVVEAERQRYQDLFDFAPDGYLLTDASGTIIEANRAVATLFNISQKFLVGKPLITFVRLKEHQDFISQLLQLQQLDRVQEWELCLQRRQGDSFEAALTVGAVSDRFGKLVALRWLVRDITERKRAEERAQLLAREQAARREAEAAQARITNILESITDAFVSVDAQWRYTYVNPQAEKILGKTAKELIGFNLWNVFPATTDSQSYTLFHQAVAEQVSVAYEEFSPIFNKWFAVRVYPSADGVSAYLLDITERKRTEEALQQRAEELAKANMMKDEFLAVVSHELRSPLTAMLGWVQTLRNCSLDAATTARALEIIERNAKAQTQLIDNLLDVSRMITGKLRLNIRSIELASIIQEVVETVRPAADAKGIKLQYLLDPAAGSILGDSERLHQVIWNLLSNAIKFTPEGGYVQIELKRLNSHVEIIVSDTGIGLSAEFLPFIFERFRQADATTTRSYSGMGLGLAIVRHLVELHGGTVQVASPGQGLGTTFTVKLPVIGVCLASNPKNSADGKPTLVTEASLDYSS